MKNGVREGLHIKCKKEEREFVSEEEAYIHTYIHTLLGLPSTGLFSHNVN